MERRDDLEQYGYLAGPKGTVIDNVTRSRKKGPPATQTRSMKPVEDRTLIDKTGGLGYACNSGDERDDARRRLGVMVLMDMHGRNANRDAAIQALQAELIRALKRSEVTTKMLTCIAAVAEVAYTSTLAPGQAVNWSPVIATMRPQRYQRLMSAALAILESSASEAATEGIKKTG